MKEAGCHTPAWDSGSPQQPALLSRHAGCPSSCAAEPESHTHESSVLGFIYQKVGWGQFVSGWPEKEAILNWVTVGVPANFSYPGLRERDRRQCLDQRHELEFSHLPFPCPLCKYLHCEKHWVTSSLPLGARPNWGLKNRLITPQKVAQPRCR